MPTDHQEPPVEIERPTDGHRKPLVWIEPSGMGWRLYTWQDWLILGVLVAAIAVVVVLLRGGLL